MSKRVYNKAEAAKAYGVSPQTIDRAIRAGRLRAKYSGETKDGEPAGRVLIAEAAMDEWFESLVDA